MWARVIEFMLAVWLAITPFIFNFSSQETFLWINQFVSAFLVALFALLSFWRPLRKIHLLTLVVSLWLCSLGYLSFPGTPLPSQQNSTVLGLLLLMLAIVPSHSHHLSPSWKRFVKKLSTKT